MSRLMTSLCHIVVQLTPNGTPLCLDTRLGGFGGSRCNCRAFLLLWVCGPDLVFPSYPVVLPHLVTLERRVAPGLFGESMRFLLLWLP